MIAIVDYKSGNLTSVRYAMGALGVEAVVTRDPQVITTADRIIFPGVGAAGSAMANLAELGLTNAVKAAAMSGKPFLGICLGMQILFEHSEEDGGVDLLGILPGKVKKFPVAGMKVPQIGWNQVNGGVEYYFVHSYYVEKGAYTTGTTDYAGVTFTSVAQRGALFAAQFHPEKSGQAGLAFLKEFVSC